MRTMSACCLTLAAKSPGTATELVCPTIPWRAYAQSTTGCDLAVEFERKAVQGGGRWRWNFDRLALPPRLTPRCKALRQRWAVLCPIARRPPFRYSPEPAIRI